LSHDTPKSGDAIATGSGAKRCGEARWRVARRSAPSPTEDLRSRAQLTPLETLGLGSNPVQQKSQLGFRRGAMLDEKLVERSTPACLCMPFVPHEQTLRVLVKDQLPRFLMPGLVPVRCGTTRVPGSPLAPSPFMRSDKYMEIERMARHPRRGQFHDNRQSGFPRSLRCHVRGI
jgi:hypothetical protein